MIDATHRDGMPVSVKGVVCVEGRVLLLRNDRDQWELPGGRPDAGETWPKALERELMEEAGIGIAVGPLVAEWSYEVLPGRFVWIAAFGCRVTTPAAAPRLSAEHRELRLVAPDALGGLALDRGYRAAIDAWYGDERRVQPVSG